MTKIDAAYVGPPAAIAAPQKGVTDAGGPIYEIGLHEAVQSDHWRPLGSIADADKIAEQKPGDAPTDHRPADLTAEQRANAPQLTGNEQPNTTGQAKRKATGGDA